MILFIISFYLFKCVRPHQEIDVCSEIHVNIHTRDVSYTQNLTIFWQHKMKTHLWRIIMSILWFYLIECMKIGRTMHFRIFTEKYAIFPISGSDNTYLILDITNMSDKHHRLQVVTFTYNVLQFLIPSNVSQHPLFYICV